MAPTFSPRRSGLLLALAGCSPKLELSQGFLRADLEREKRELDDTLYALIAPADGSGFWAGSYLKARWFKLKPRP